VDEALTFQLKVRLRGWKADRAMHVIKDLVKSTLFVSFVHLESLDLHFAYCSLRRALASLEAIDTPHTNELVMHGTKPEHSVFPRNFLHIASRHRPRRSFILLLLAISLLLLLSPVQRQYPV